MNPKKFLKRFRTVSIKLAGGKVILAAARISNPQKRLRTEDYPSIRSIDGSHPFKERCPGAYVEYQARVRRGAEVVYFNFELAKEMGLIAANHANEVTPKLRQALIETFSIQIINEYDIIHKTRIPQEDIKPNRYMATRYLQLQHPDKHGLTSGDGRSVWNGYHSHRGVTWDISSCGTGATCLSPATAIQKRFFRTGDPEISYGCGYNDLHDGVSNAIFSDILHKNNIRTERTLLVLGYPGDLCIVVRAGQNLLRPSHFFNHLRQEKLARLRSVVDFYIDRQINNGSWPQVPKTRRYDQFLYETALTFARMSAKFEADYIFCWLDWDGDNILADGGIIDYGSIRQFGLFHHEYRYDDTDRWSTSIKEQKERARHILRTCAQMVDYLKTGNKKNLSHFDNHPILREFDREFDIESRILLMERLGFERKTAAWLARNRVIDVNGFQRIFRSLEMAKSSRGIKKVPDGINCDVLFCMRDILRELPVLANRGLTPISTKVFISIIRSEYATRRECRLTNNLHRKVRRFQSYYKRFIAGAASFEGKSKAKVIESLADRSSLLNRYERVTGNSILEIGQKLLHARRRLTSSQFHRLLQNFIEEQVLVPERRRQPELKPLTKPTLRVSRSILRIVRDYRDGI